MKIVNELKNDIKEYNKMFGHKNTTKHFEEDILNLNNPELSCFFALNIEGANLPEHFNVIFNSKDYWSLYYFCRKYFQTLQINMYELVKIIAENGSLDLNYKLIEDSKYYFRNLDIYPCVKTILKSDNYKLMKKFLCSTYQLDIRDMYIYRCYESDRLNVKLSKEEIEEIGRKFLTAHPYYSYVYAAILQDKGFDISNHLNRILESDDIKANYFVVNQITCCNKKKHLDRIIESKNADINIAVIRNIKEIDKDAHINAIIESGDVDVMFKLLYISNSCRFNTKLKREDFIRIFEKTYESKNLEYNYEIIRNYSEIANIKKHAEIILDGDDMEYIYNLILKFPNIIDVNEARKKITNSNNPEYNYLLAKKFSDNERHVEAIIASGSAKYCYETAKNIESCYTNQLEEVVINSEDAQYNYKFALNVDGADTSHHLEVIIKSLDPEYNYLAIQNIKGADVERHMDAILESGNLDYIDKFKEIQSVKKESIKSKIKRLIDK